MPTIPSYLLDPLTGLPKKQKPSQPTSTEFGNNVFGPQTGPSAGQNFLTPSVTALNVPGSTSVPGFIPDYASLIANDPMLKQTQADLGANNVTDAASRNAAINRALVQFGAVPDAQKASSVLGIDFGSLIDPTTTGLAAKNQFSTEAQIEKANKQGISQLRQALAARGGLRSGALGIGLQQLTDARGQAENDATQQLLDALSGYQSQYAAGVRAAQEQLRAEQQAAAQRQIASNPATGSQTAQFSFVDANGVAVYQAPDGSLYTAAGTRYSGPGQAPAAPPPPPPPSAPDVSPSIPGLSPNYGIPTQLSGSFNLNPPNAYNRKTVANIH